MNETNRVKYFSKEYWKINWKFILINLAIFFCVFLFFLMIDLVTKETIFKWADKSRLFVDSKWEAGGKFVTFRSVLHEGTTLGFLETNLGFLHFISFMIFFGAIFAVTFIKDKKLIYVTVFLAIVSAGAFGNMIDRFLFKGVRDIINLPWVNQGVFNFADVWLVLGGVGILVAIILEATFGYFKSKKAKSIQENKLQEQSELQIPNPSKDKENDMM
ncbi:Lipoprotein signal peptidase [Metamycoplasma auris 15026]|uniref:Lipoprotein signal peptidase n=1 Tax=Metamycoplasma auris 15026 TaxID=1188233 RepID=N9VAX3_9BACT|nr:signal peptidase II [Metamycoplasma auris]ENY68828.1 Lipoprotein signal peptidase [Metamycoplasma auris 15026]